MSPDFTPISGFLGGALIGLAAVLLLVANGRIAGNRHISTPAATPMANLLLNLAQVSGVEMDRFGVSRGTVDL